MLLLILCSLVKVKLNLKNIFLLTGSNIEPRLSFLEEAESEIGRKVGSVLKKSEIYESAPWGFEAKTSFLNRVLLINSELVVTEILKAILEIEKEMGRVRRSDSYASRNIDIDILYFGEAILEQEFLQIPHPRLHLRRFTLIPLTEIAPTFIHPKFSLSNQELLDCCEDHSIVNKFKVENN